MRKQLKTRIAMALSVASLMAGSYVPLAEAAQKKSKTVKSAADAASSTIIFQAELGTDPFVFRDHTGKEIGRLSDEKSLEITIANDLLKKATTKSGINSMALIGGLPRTTGLDGKALVMMRLPSEFKTQDGRVLPPGYPVWIEQELLSKAGALQPAGARASLVAETNSNPAEIAKVAEANKVADAFVDAVQKGGVKDVPQKFEHKDHGDTYTDRVPLDEKNNRVFEEMDGRFLSSPTCGCMRGSCQVTSRFGRRPRPKTRSGYGSSHHGGLDIGGGKGTPILAAADGCITRKMANRRTGFGNTIELDHKNGFRTTYSHMEGFTPNARLGQCFKRGEQIGTMGATGNCSGPHLHFGVKKDGENVNPERYLMTRRNSDYSNRCDDLRESLKQFETAPTAPRTSIADGQPGLTAPATRSN